MKTLQYIGLLLLFLCLAALCVKFILWAKRKKAPVPISKHMSTAKFTYKDSGLINSMRYDKKIERLNHLLTSQWDTFMHQCNIALDNHHNNCRKAKSCIAGSCAGCVVYSPAKTKIKINWTLLLGIAFCLAWWYFLISVIIKLSKG